MGRFGKPWMPGHIVKVSSDIVSQRAAYSPVHQWCNNNVDNRMSWAFSGWSGNYEHTFHFENEDDAKAFKTFYKLYRDKLLKR